MWSRILKTLGYRRRALGVSLLGAKQGPRSDVRLKGPNDLDYLPLPTKRLLLAALVYSRTHIQGRGEGKKEFVTSDPARTW